MDNKVSYNDVLLYTKIILGIDNGSHDTKLNLLLRQGIKQLDCKSLLVKKVMSVDIVNGCGVLPKEVVEVVGVKIDKLNLYYISKDLDCEANGGVCVNIYRNDTFSIHNGHLFLNTDVDLECKVVCLVSNVEGGEQVVYETYVTALGNYVASMFATSRLGNDYTVAQYQIYQSNYRAAKRLIKANEEMVIWKQEKFKLKNKLDNLMRLTW